ncbi:hypothetical protein C7S18_17715 [Ahniella affigens]|uniref:Uncharacterized protein n=1 Tax=Ahniella affigens TaxID=2021234 RepID=A0A2P1PVQ0_9GAMM|nr:hypothetical protein C7S18_17715 [Ahniella affigens]
MKEEQALDLESRIKAIAVSRPTLLRVDGHEQDLVAWAIKALEDAGIYPSLKWITKVAGGQVAQRDLEPTVAKFYEHRKLEQKRKNRVNDVDHLADLYQVVLARAREEVRAELSDEMKSIHAEWQKLEQKQQQIENERREVARQLLLVEEARLLTQSEVQQLRDDQRAMVEKVAQSAIELAAARSESDQLGRV